MKYIILMILVVGSFGQSFAQGTELEEENEAFRPQIRGAIMMMNSHVPRSFDQERNVAVIPAWGFDVDYFFHPKWSTALQADLKIQSFEVEDEGVLLERSFPFSVATVIHYHFKRHWSVFTGPGYEFEKNENLYFWKLGTEYSFEISEEFEIALNLSFENKQNVYDSWNFGIAFNKLLWRKN
ncbi:hypothetical protein [Algoriphagus litoralis]|uniref:hypothetical protein n=1 Tax=Algoriphagus litoralis TaxID=2202829 RepID=UPI000DBA78E1|nr:hypothetical protein [Algoriphagus litoralis]